MSLTDLQTREHHELYVSRWLAVEQDDHQVVRELAVHRSPAADTLPGMTASLRLVKCSSVNYDTFSTDHRISLLSANCLLC